MNPRFVLRLRSPSAVLDDRDGVSIRLSASTLRLPEVPLGVRRALSGLAEGAADAELSQVADDGGAESLTLWYYCVELLQRDGCLTCDVVDAERLLARATATAAFSPGRGVLSDRWRWALSRFAFVRCVDSVFVIESALSPVRVELFEQRVMRLANALAEPLTVDEAVSRHGDLGETAARDFLGLLEYAGMLTRVDEHGVRSEDTIPSLGAWDFADLLFHRRSRTFRRTMPRDTDEAPATPAVKPPMSDQTIALQVPEMDVLDQNDAPFTRVLERRRSVREAGERPISLTEVGDFLYRAARVKRRFEPDGRCEGHELTERPYPGAGARYELEVYLAVADCDGLARGFYHYDPSHHRLECIASDGADVARLLDDASLAAGSVGRRQVLVILAARFGRLSTKYGAGSYALVLKDAGVLLQTMCLVATSLNLASCVLGSGDAEVFARAAGAEAYAEASVAEILLGSLPSG